MILFNLMENLFLYGCSDFYIKKYIMNTNKVNRGSEWRKWDLHVHTPLSIEQEYGGNTPENWERFISDLERLPSEIKVIGINDYIFIDGYKKVLDEKQKGRLSNIELILPVIELRIDKFANVSEDDPLKRINFHIIFSNELTSEQIESQFLNALSAEYKLETEYDYDNESDWGGVITRENIELLGKKLIESSKGKIKGSPLKIGFNSLNIPYEKLMDKLKNPLLKNKFLTAVGKVEWDTMRWDGSPAEKKNIINRANFVFSASPTVELAVKARESLKSQSVNYKLLHCSDAHTFINNLQNTKEKELGHCFTWIKADPTFEGLKQIIYEYGERVKIQENKPEEKSGYQVIDKIEIYHQDFQEKIEKKGNKETIEENEEYKTIFLNPNLNTIIGGRSTGKSILLGAIAKKLNSDKEVKLDNTEYSQYIDEIVSSMKIFWKDGDENSTRDIEYFPQSYMYQLAKNSDELNKLVENIITQDINKKTKIEAYQAFSSDNNSKIIEDINKLFKAKSTIDSIKKSITEIGDEEGITKEKGKLSIELEGLKAKIQITEEQWSIYSNLKDEYDKNNRSIQEIEQQQTSLSALKSLSIINDISLNLIDLTEDIKNRVQTIFSDLKQRYYEEWNGQIQTILLEKEVEIQKIKERNESIEKDESYLKGKSVIDSNQQYKEKEEKYEIENGKLEEITKLKKQKAEHEKHINSLKDSIIENSKKYYTELQQIQDKLSDSSGKLKITATINTDFSKYKNILFGSINQSSSQGKQFVEKLINTTEELFDDMSSIFGSLLSNTITLKGGYDNKKLIKELLGTNFFNISYEIEHDTDKFKAMSEGKKAFIILMLLLDFSNKQCPILIDQPEDDLDNRAIYNELVTYIKNKKKERQIIIVTHNSNIVIGADSELVIVSNQQGVNSPNKNNKKFDYIFGSIESSMEKDNTISEILYSQGIRQHICEILEGGETAFKNRERKYGF